MDGVGAIRNGWARKAGGWTLLAVGIAGCVLPVIPGIPLALAGLLVLAPDYAWARSALRSTKRGLVRMRRRARAKKRAHQAAVSRVGTSRSGDAEEA
jgi:uncharacterized protein YqgC (DUF456 family)